MQRGRMNVVFGGQAGSEAKGKLAAYLAQKYNIRVFAGCLSPNAGHTVIKDGKKYVTHHIPVGVAGNMGEETVIVIGAGAVVNLRLLEKEIGELGIDPVNVFLDERAVAIDEDHIKKEIEGLLAIGSTAQGVGEARADKVMRRVARVGDVVMGKRDEFPLLKDTIVQGSNRVLTSLMDRGETVMYEMGQGFDLCFDHGVNPVYCTSRNCTPMQALADMGIPPRYLGDTYAVIRPYPIRVNNRTGSSGPYPSKEINWEAVRDRCGAPEDLTELTTTTKLPRRVFEFSEPQISRMVRVCDPTFLCLQFANYISWNCYKMKKVSELGLEVLRFIQKVEVATGKKVGYVGTGPEQDEMVDMGYDTRVEV